MALPKLKTPRFDLTLPVSGTKITARPFLIREQKILLQALEMGDLSQVNNAIFDILTTCTFDQVDINKLSLADVEWLVLQLRSKSVSEDVDLVYTCNNTVPNINEDGVEDGVKKCNTKMKVRLNLNDVKVKHDKNHISKIMLGDEIGMILKDVSYGVYKEAMNKAGTLESNEMIRNDLVESIFDSDQVWQRSDFTDEELIEFIEGLYTKDYDKIENYMNTMPILEHSLTIKCRSCGHEETIVLSGLDDFLA